MSVTTLSTDVSYTRRGGSGFTVFVYGGMPIAYAQQVTHQSPQLVAQPSIIQPIDEPYALEIATPMAASPGTIVLNLYDLWGNTTMGYKVWDTLGPVLGTSPPALGSNSGLTQGYANISGSAGGIFNGASDIVDLAIIQAQANPLQTTIVQYIRPLPGLGQGVTSTSTTSYSGSPSYYITYNGCTITAVSDVENIQVGTVQIIKNITVMYTYATRSGGSSNTNIARTLRANAPS